MTFLHIAILALVEGVTRVLPIGSAGHLAVTSELLGWPKADLLVEAAVHAGILLALLAYFWRDVWEMLAGGVGALAGNRTPGLRLLLFLTVATIPVVVATYLGMRYIGAAIGGIEMIAWTTLLFGLLLGITDRLCMTVRRLEHTNYVGALFVGAVQILSLMPGTSRAGVAITACRLLGMERQEAARISILLSVPTLLGAVGLTGLALYEAGDLALRADAALAAALSFSGGLIAIDFMMRMLVRTSFMPFVIYRVFLGAGLLYWVYS